MFVLENICTIIYINVKYKFKTTYKNLFWPKIGTLVKLSKYILIFCIWCCAHGLILKLDAYALMS